MKKTLLVTGLLFMMASCSKSNEQIEIVKKDVTKDLSKAESESMKFESFEILDKDAYDFIVKKYEKQQKIYSSTETSKLISKYIDSSGTATGKKFYKVHYYRLAANDTVADGYVILNDKNKKVGFEYLK